MICMNSEAKIDSVVVFPVGDELDSRKRSHPSEVVKTFGGFLTSEKPQQSVGEQHEMGNRCSNSLATRVDLVKTSVAAGLHKRLLDLPSAPDPLVYPCPNCGIMCMFHGTTHSQKPTAKNDAPGRQCFCLTVFVPNGTI